MAEKIITDKRPCIWMDAGVIDFKICDHDFDCRTCEFDWAMTESAAHHLARRQETGPPGARKAEAGPWEEKMQQRFGGHRKCQLMKTRLCHQCSFDELLEDQFDFFLAPERPRMQEVFGIQVPTSNFLHRGHTWVALENAGRVRIGLDGFSQKVLGAATKIKLPEVGKVIHANAPVLSLTRQRKEAAVLAPLNGVIEAVNPEVREKPGLAHDDPYGEGWLFVVTPTDLKQDLEKMLFGQCNVAWIESETHRLLGLLETTAGITLPSGGALIDDVFGHYPQLGWSRLVREFLHTA